MIMACVKIGTVIAYEVVDSPSSHKSSSEPFQILSFRVLSYAPFHIANVYIVLLRGIDPFSVHHEKSIFQ